MTQCPLRDVVIVKAKSDPYRDSHEHKERFFHI